MLSVSDLKFTQSWGWKNTICSVKNGICSGVPNISIYGGKKPCLGIKIVCPAKVPSVHLLQLQKWKWPPWLMRRRTWLSWRVGLNSLWSVNSSQKTRCMSCKFDRRATNWCICNIVLLAYCQVKVLCEKAKEILSKESNVQVSQLPSTSLQDYLHACTQTKPTQPFYIAVAS